MWSRFLRVFSTGLNAWQFYNNPVQFILSILLIIVAPYLIYVFWGSIFFVIFLAVGGWFIYQSFKKRRSRW